MAWKVIPRARDTALCYVCRRAVKVGQMRVTFRKTDSHVSGSYRVGQAQAGLDYNAHGKCAERLWDRLNLN